MIILTEVNVNIAENMNMRNYKVYKFNDKLLVQDSDLNIYTEAILDEEFDKLSD